MTRDNEADDSTRRTVLKTLAAAGVAGTGIAGASGSAAAQGQRSGSYRNRLRFEGPVVTDEDGFDDDQRGEVLDTWTGEFVEDNPLGADEGADGTFDGRLDITGLDVVGEDEIDFDEEVIDPADDDDTTGLYLVASGRLQGRLSENPTTQINETFDIVIGLLEEVIQLLEDLLEGLVGDDNGLLDPEEGECPILTLDVGPIFLDLLGLQVDLSRIELDITAVAGEGNLLGNLLCAVANLLN
ncbi:hypothetical protein [Natronorarus salvus]|uniref:hypothetical protein n=1 Tax=Natronorarus salvus TaxID=3117733 RepID=UPI002F26A374